MDECPECGEKYKSLGQHWRYSPSHRPKLTQEQEKITTGVLMADGSIHDNSGNCYLKVDMISPKYLKYLDSVFGCLGNGFGIVATASESAERHRKTGFNSNAKKENYSDLYRWRTCCHPKFNEFREWYSSGEKVWPKDIELTPTVLKHWYVGDGCYDNNERQKRITIGMNNEIKNTSKVSQYFTNVGLPKPSNYNKRGEKCDVVWTIEDSYELWDYMGKPLPDFEYKWPEEYR